MCGILACVCRALLGKWQELPGLGLVDAARRDFWDPRKVKFGFGCRNSLRDRPWPKQHVFQVRVLGKLKTKRARIWLEKFVEELLKKV